MNQSTQNEKAGDRSPQLGIIGNVIKKFNASDKTLSKPFNPNTKLLKNETEALEDKDITTLRVPIFCSENKPFVFIKVMNKSEKYRLSMNPEFLKSYSLNFKILRDQSLIDFIKWSNSNGQRVKIDSPLIKKSDGFTDPENKSQTSIYLKLPAKHQNILINKHTMILENDGKPGKTIIDKYQIVFPELDGKFSDSSKRTILFIIDRNFKEYQNSSIAFISEEFDTFHDFLIEYTKMFKTN